MPLPVSSRKIAGSMLGTNETTNNSAMGIIQHAEEAATMEVRYEEEARLESIEVASCMSVMELVAYLQRERGITDGTAESYKERLFRMAKLRRAYRLVEEQQPGSLAADNDTVASVALRLEDSEDESLSFVRDSAVLIPLLERTFSSKTTLRYHLYACRLAAEVAFFDRFLAAAYTSALRKLTIARSPRSPRRTRSRELDQQGDATAEPMSESVVEPSHLVLAAEQPLLLA
jgi:hypothetical protein